MRELSISWAADAGLPIDIALVKSQLRLIESDFDAAIESMHIPAAVQWAESLMRRSILSKVHTWTVDSFPWASYEPIRLPRGKCTKIESIVYIDAKVTRTLKGASSTIPGTDYQEDLSNDSGALLMPPQGGAWPSADYDAIKPVTVTFTAGWTNAAIPADILLALTRYVSDALFIPNALDIKDAATLDIKDQLLSNWCIRRM